MTAAQASSAQSSRRVVVGEVLLHPLTLVCAVLWSLNDHVWKASFGNWWTGKLSDVCSLVVFPLFLLTLLQLCSAVAGRPRLARWQVWAAVSFVGVAFAAINLIPAADLAYRFVVVLLQAPAAALAAPAQSAALVQHTRDATDLLTLPALLGAFWIAARAAKAHAQAKTASS